MNPLSKLGKRVALLTATLALLVGLGAGQASAASSAHLFWGGWYDGIGHASPDGTSTQRAFISGPGNQTFVAANDQYVYWSTVGGSIGRAKVDGSDQQPNLISGYHRGGGIALDETYVYWIEQDFGPSSIGRAKLDGSEIDSNFITGIRTTGGMNGLAVDDQHIYWAGSMNVGRADINGQNVQAAYVPAHGAGEVNGVAVDATHVYWTTRGDGVHHAGIFRAPLADTSTPELIVPAPSDAWLQVAVDNEHLYFSRYSEAGWIGRADLDGTNADFEFISTAGHPNGSYPVGIALAPAPAATVSSNADLAGLSLFEGALAPAFSAATTSYGLQVAYAIKNAHLTATLADASATVTVNGTAATPGAAVTVPLVVGPNTLSVVVTAENGAPKTYTLTITRAADTKAPTFKARFLKSKNGRVWVNVKASDTGSGVRKLQLALRRDRPLPWRAFVVNASTRTKQGVIWVRVSDTAGNISAWQKVTIPAKAR